MHNALVHNLSTLELHSNIKRTTFLALRRKKNNKKTDEKYESKFLFYLILRFPLHSLRNINKTKIAH